MCDEDFVKIPELARIEHVPGSGILLNVVSLNVHLFF
jgi:hypothetical protein